MVLFKMVLFENVPIFFPLILCRQQNYSKRLEGHYFSTKPLEADVFENP